MKKSIFVIMAIFTIANFVHAQPTILDTKEYDWFLQNGNLVKTKSGTLVYGDDDKNLYVHYLDKDLKLVRSWKIENTAGSAFINSFGYDSLNEKVIFTLYNFGKKLEFITINLHADAIKRVEAKPPKGLNLISSLWFGGKVWLYKSGGFRSSPSYVVDPENPVFKEVRLPEKPKSEVKLGNLIPIGDNRLAAVLNVYIHGANLTDIAIFDEHGHVVDSNLLDGLSENDRKIFYPTQIIRTAEDQYYFAGPYDWDYTRFEGGAEGYIMEPKAIAFGHIENGKMQLFQHYYLLKDIPDFLNYMAPEEKKEITDFQQGKLKYLVNTSYGIYMHPMVYMDNNVYLFAEFYQLLSRLEKVKPAGSNFEETHRIFSGYNYRHGMLFTFNSNAELSETRMALITPTPLEYNSERKLGLRLTSLGWITLQTKNHIIHTRKYNADEDLHDSTLTHPKLPTEYVKQMSYMKNLMIADNIFLVAEFESGKQKGQIGTSFNKVILHRVRVDE